MKKYIFPDIRVIKGEENETPYLKLETFVRIKRDGSYYELPIQRIEVVTEGYNETRSILSFIKECWFAYHFFDKNNDKGFNLKKASNQINEKERLKEYYNIKII